MIVLNKIGFTTLSPPLFFLQQGGSWTGFCDREVPTWDHPKAYGTEATIQKGRRAREPLGERGIWEGSYCLGDFAQHNGGVRELWKATASWCFTRLYVLSVFSRCWVTFSQYPKQGGSEWLKICSLGYFKSWICKSLSLAPEGFWVNGSQPVVKK